MRTKKLTPAQKRALTIARNKRVKAARLGWETRKRNEARREREKLARRLKFKKPPPAPPRKRRKRYAEPYEELFEFISEKITETTEESDDTQDVYSQFGKRLKGPIKVLRLDLWIANQKDKKGAGRVIRFRPRSQSPNDLTKQILETLRASVKKKDVYFYVIIKGRNKRGQTGYRTLPKMIL